METLSVVDYFRCKDCQTLHETRQTVDEMPQLPTGIEDRSE